MLRCPHLWGASFQKLASAHFAEMPTIPRDLQSDLSFRACQTMERSAAKGFASARFALDSTATNSGKGFFMDRRRFLSLGVTTLTGTLVGCRSYQTAHVLDADDKDLVGSHAAGAETYQRLIDESVGKLLGRACEPTEIQPAGMVIGERKKICFIGVENCTAEEIGDFKEQIYELIDSAINESQQFHQISRRYVDAGLKQLRIRPDELFVKENQRNFQVAMEEMGQPFDFLLYAKLTSGTTQQNKDYQRDYLLTLELVNIHTGDFLKDSAKLRKGYHKTWLGRIFKY